MTAPLIIRNPLLAFQPLDEAGAPQGAAVDVSVDTRTAELGVDPSIDEVVTFAGTFQVPGKISQSCTLGLVVTPDTHDNWAPLIGERLLAHLYDRSDAAQYRQFETTIMFDPSLFGTTDPSASPAVREIDFDIPVLSDIEWVDVAS